MFCVLRHLPLHLHLRCHCLISGSYTIFFPSFFLTLLILIFSLFPVDIFTLSLCECHSKWVHAQLSAGVASTQFKHKWKIKLICGRPSKLPMQSVETGKLSPVGVTFQVEAKLDSLVFQKMPWLCRQPETARHLKEGSIKSLSFYGRQPRPHRRTFHCLAFLRFMLIFFNRCHQQFALQGSPIQQDPNSNLLFNSL